jgi:hypothetical protein
MELTLIYNQFAGVAMATSTCSMLSALTARHCTWTMARFRSSARAKTSRAASHCSWPPRLQASKHWTSGSIPARRIRGWSGTKCFTRCWRTDASAHQWTILPGGHEGLYWQRNIERYLRFYDAALNRRLNKTA